MSCLYILPPSRKCRLRETNCSIYYTSPFPSIANLKSRLRGACVMCRPKVMAQTVSTNTCHLCAHYTSIIEVHPKCRWGPFEIFSDKDYGL